jgi:predicted porin
MSAVSLRPFPVVARPPAIRPRSVGPTPVPIRAISIHASPFGRPSSDLDNGFTNRAIVSQAIPGFNSKLIDGGIKSPNQKEFTLGAGTQIGKGYIRADYIHRDWQDFYAAFTSLAIGTVNNPATNTPSDLTLTGNSSVPTRKYWGAQFQGQYQLPAGFGLGGNYTYSKLTGNIEGETTGGGPVTFGGLNLGQGLGTTRRTPPIEPSSPISATSPGTPCDLRHQDRSLTPASFSGTIPAARSQHLRRSVVQPDATHYPDGTPSRPIGSPVCERTDVHDLLQSSWCVPLGRRHRFDVA